MPKFPCARLRHVPAAALLAAVMLTGCATVEPEATPEPAAIDQTSVKAALTQADAALSKGDFTTARQGYRKVLTLAPGNSAAQLGLGEVELVAGDPHQALDQFASVAAADQTLRPGALQGQGITLLKLLQPEAATPILKEAVTLDQNVLVVRIQPDEGISFRMQAKIPGTSLRIEPVKMDFHYGTSFGKASPEAYERLLLDAMAGDATLFARRDEVEGAWSFIDRIEAAWHENPAPPPLCEYPAGSWGPKEADELLSRDGRTWRRM